MEDRGGRLEVLIPYATLEPVRELLLQMFMGEKSGVGGSIWETHLAEELWVTDIELTAVLDQLTMTLGEVFEFKVGSQLQLNAKPNSVIEVQCGDILMFSGKMGRKGDTVAVRINERHTKDRTNENWA
jgi:flagellar motor switch protein FliM